MKDPQSEAGAGTGTGTSRGAAGGGRSGGGGSSAQTQSSASTTGGAAANRSAAKPSQRTTGLLIRKPTHRKIAGKVTEERGAELDDFLVYCKEVDGVEPDTDEVLENALAALFSRAKGFGPWRKERATKSVADDVESAIDNLIVADGSQASTGGAGASAS
jgi:hypothetical protein